MAAKASGNRTPVRLRIKRAIVAVSVITVFTYINVTRNLWVVSGTDHAVDSSVGIIDFGRPTKSQKSQPLQLKVPFYVYDNSTLNWEHFTFQHGGHENYGDFKHSDDLWLYRASLRHPLRTMDPTQAKLFFVPVFLNAVAERKTCLHLNATWDRCFVRSAAGYHFADKHLGLSEYYRRSQGKDHVIVLSHWMGPPRNVPNLLRCNLINFEGHLPVPTSENVSSIPGFYVGKPCYSLDDPWTFAKTYDFTMVATMKPGNPDFSSREDICQWLGKGNYSVSNCGFGDHCPTLPQSKFGLHPRGDTWGSQRVMDLVFSRTIPLFTDSRQYDLLPPFVPWKDLSYSVNVSSQESFEMSLQSILARPASEYHAKLRLIEDYMHLFDYQQIYQFDAYMAAFATRLSLQ